jgi:hypothetical protein
MLRRAVTNPIGNHLGFEAYPRKYKLAQNTVNVKKILLRFWAYLNPQ